MDELLDPFRRMIEAACTPATVRLIEAGGDWRPLWNTIDESGFLDALVEEDAGGVGLSFAEVADLIALCGNHVVPLPVGETMVARALLTRADKVVPQGPIVLATGAWATPLARVATHALTGSAEAPRLIALDDLAPLGPINDLGGVIEGATAELRPIAAVIRAQLIAGAMDRILEMSVAYANERNQFGKAIGRQQAVQQQLAVLAEQAVATRIAAGIGARTGLYVSPKDAGIAKYWSSRAAAIVASIAHGVHGAIGISEEYDLQQLTRSLHRWRLADGSESYWAEEIGRPMLGKTAIR